MVHNLSILVMVFALNKVYIKNKILFFIVGIISIFVISLFFMKDYLPPRTAYKIARINSDLDIKNTFEIVDYTEEYSFNGKGIINIIFKLNDLELKNLIQSCQREGYKKVTVNNLVKDGFLKDNPDFGINLYNRNIREITDGLYRLNAKDLNKLDFSITVLDISNKELIVYVNIP